MSSNVRVMGTVQVVFQDEVQEALLPIAASLEKIANPPLLVEVEKVDTAARAENTFPRARLSRYEVDDLRVPAHREIDD